MGNLVSKWEGVIENKIYIFSLFSIIIYNLS